MVNLFFLFSGEHKTLPLSELKAVLEAEGYQYKILALHDQTLRLESDLECLNKLKRKVAYTRFCGLELFCSKANI